MRNEQTAENDFASAFAPIGNIVGWCLFFGVTMLPLSGLALVLYTSPRWNGDELMTAWILSFVALSLVIYAVVERARGTSPRSRVFRGVVLAPLLALMGSIPPVHLFGAYDRGQQKRAVANVRDISQAICHYVTTRNMLLGVDEVSELNAVAHLQLPTHDPWGCPYRIEYQDDDWFLVSTGSDCVADVEDLREYREGPEHRFEADIVVKNGEFLKWPEGMQE